jgi:ribosome-interacting GTPase 1
MIQDNSTLSKSQPSKVTQLEILDLKNQVSKLKKELKTAKENNISSSGSGGQDLLGKKEPVIDSKAYDNLRKTNERLL